MQPTQPVPGRTSADVVDGRRDVAGSRRHPPGHAGGPTRLEVVPVVSHLFEESRALEHVANLASDWFATT
jgi:hypothetical protein